MDIFKEIYSMGLFKGILDRMYSGERLEGLEVGELTEFGHLHPFIYGRVDSRVLNRKQQLTLFRRAVCRGHSLGDLWDYLELTGLPVWQLTTRELKIFD